MNKSFFTGLTIGAVGAKKIYEQGKDNSTTIVHNHNHNYNTTNVVVAPKPEVPVIPTANQTNVDSFNNNFALHSPWEHTASYIDCYFQYIDSLFFYRSLVIYVLPFILLLVLQIYVSKLVFTYLKNRLNKKYVLIHKYISFMDFSIQFQKKGLFYFSIACLFFDVAIAIFT